MKRTLVLTFLLILLAAGLSAIEWTDWSLDAGFGILVNTQIGTEAEGKQPSKMFFSPGASFHGDFDGETGGMYFRPGAWLSWSIENLYDGVARPCDPAEPDHMKVLGLMADFPFGYLFTPGNLQVGLQFGPALYLRFPLYTAQTFSADPVDFWKAYYSGQFLYLSFASWVSFPVSEEGMNDLLIGLRVYQPLSNIWTAASFAQGMQVGLLVSFRFGFPPAEGS